MAEDLVSEGYAKTCYLPPTSKDWWLTFEISRPIKEREYLDLSNDSQLWVLAQKNKICIDYGSSFKDREEVKAVKFSDDGRYWELVYESEWLKGKGANKKAVIQVLEQIYEVKQ